MHRNERLLAALLVAGSLSNTAPSAGGDLSAAASYESGEYGTGTESTVRAGWLQYTAGDRFRYRIAASYLDIRGSDFVYLPGLGPAPGQRGMEPGEPGRPQHEEDSDGGHGKNGNRNGDGNQNQSSGDARQESGQDTRQESAYAARGPGDIWVSGVYRLTGGGASVYRLDAGLDIKVPTAEEGKLGTGQWDYRPMVSGEYRFWTALVFASLGWNLLGDPSWAEFDDPLDFVLGVETDPVRDRLILSGWVEGSEEFVPGVGSRSAIGVSVRSVGRVQWRLTATAGLGGASEDYGISMGVSTGLDSLGPGLRGAGP